MHVSQPGLKYTPFFFMFHRHKVSLFAIQSLLNFSNSLAHLSLPMPIPYLNASVVPILGYLQR